jgi:hypothetical protein
VELVPSPVWGSNLRTALSKSNWDRLRKAKYQEVQNRCEVCGGKGRRHPVECHEVWEYNDQNKVQKLVGLKALCPPCHRVKHLGLAMSSGYGDVSLQHLARVNGWSVQEAEAYAREAFGVWECRSVHDWHLDLSWLTEQGVPLPPWHTKTSSEKGRPS